MKRQISILALMASGLGANPVLAAEPGHGEQLAQRWCATCHVVSIGQRQATDAAPPFSTVAKVPQFDAHKLAFFLLDPHPKMPNMTLSRRDAEDLAAFIAASAK
jgi:mono/diheme cytochrome c family protein